MPSGIKLLKLPDCTVRITEHHSENGKNEDDRVWGAAYHIPASHAEEVHAYLDDREIDGYTAHFTPFHPLTETNGERQKEVASTPPVTCMVYIGLPSNPQFLRSERERDPEAVAKVIVNSKGQSGLNREYLYLLEKALQGIGLDTADGHVVDLVGRVKRLEGFDQPSQEVPEEEEAGLEVQRTLSEIQGRPRDTVVQWLLSVPEPEGITYDSLVAEGAATAYPSYKKSGARKGKSISSHDLVEEPSRLQAEPRDTVLHTMPHRGSEEGRSSHERRKKSSLDVRSDTSSYGRKTYRRRFGRRPRHKTREDKYEPKQKKEPTTKGRKRSQTDGQMKKNGAKRPSFRRSTTTASLETNFKPTNIAQVPDLSFTDMGYLSKTARGLTSLDAYDDKSPMSRKHASACGNQSSFFSEPQKHAGGKSSYAHHHHRPQEDCLKGSSEQGMMPFRTPSSNSTSRIGMKASAVWRLPENVDSQSTDKRRRAVTPSDSATVVYSWSPTVSSSTRLEKRKAVEEQQNASIKASPVQVRGSSDGVRVTPGSLPSLNSSLLSRTRKKLFQNAFIGEESCSAQSSGEGRNYSLERLQELSKQLSESPCGSRGFDQERSWQDHDEQEGAKKSVKGMLNEEIKLLHPPSAEDQIGQQADQEYQAGAARAISDERQNAKEERVTLQEEPEELWQYRPWGTSHFRDDCGSYTHPPAEIYPDMRHSGTTTTQVVVQDRPENRSLMADVRTHCATLPTSVHDDGMIMEMTNRSAEKELEPYQVSTPALLESLMDTSLSPSDMELLKQVLGESGDQFEPPEVGNKVPLYLEDQRVPQSRSTCDGGCCDTSGAHSQDGPRIMSATELRNNTLVNFWRPNKLY
ncbi:hypothetical protein KEM54_004157 [Ascosphaera aggregata]|nr:hypothetical protein KEM54_004157 [Ascosphaera aggregata]